ncbi:uncharacterized protein BDZ99DRAFT_139912 [Mytilinidion resinicola]|uniref:Uncharacterized protein n=1 Tax=Mytilinidion resinicola TaxID=574789 RepID=A0A6A6Z672_9PEZI|nr:uncharacterized protein BDZ99DRAFT_139912 [Mytilinidion resinicola]KAF2816602.1 hypothetical protein BDZ99DRAFT_139912 [Mytilinidion resinicola]
MTSPKLPHEREPDSDCDAPEDPPATPPSQLFSGGWGNSYADVLRKSNSSPLHAGTAGSELHHHSSPAPYDNAQEESASDPGGPMDMTDDEDSGFLASDEDSSDSDAETTSAPPMPVGGEHLRETQDMPIDLASEVNESDEEDAGMSVSGEDSPDSDAETTSPKHVPGTQDMPIDLASDSNESDEETKSSTMLADGTTADLMEGVEAQDGGMLETDAREDSLFSEEAPSEPESITKVFAPATDDSEPKELRLRCDVDRCVHILRCGHAVLAIDAADGMLCAKNCIRPKGRHGVEGELGCRLCYRLNNGPAVSWYLQRLDDLLLRRHVAEDESEKMQKYRPSEIVFLVNDGVVFPRAIRAAPHQGVLRNALDEGELDFDVVGAKAIPADTLKNIGDIREAVSVAAEKERARYDIAKRQSRVRRPTVDVKAREALISQIEHFSEQLEHEVAPKKPAGWGAKMTACYIFELVDYGTMLPLSKVDVVMAACIATGFERLQYEVAGVSVARVCELTHCKMGDVEAAMETLRGALYRRAVNPAGHNYRSLKRTLPQLEVLVWIAKEMEPKA